jgi:hypothetical protein
LNNHHRAKATVANEKIKNLDAFALLFEGLRRFYS